MSEATPTVSAPNFVGVAGSCPKLPNIGTDCEPDEPLQPRKEPKRYWTSIASEFEASAKSTPPAKTLRIVTPSKSFSDREFLWRHRDEIKKVELFVPPSRDMEPKTVLVTFQFKDITFNLHGSSSEDLHEYPFSIHIYYGEQRLLWSTHMSEQNEFKELLESLSQTLKAYWPPKEYDLSGGPDSYLQSLQAISLAKV
ncbi:MAG: hypothetical protein AAFP80_15435 [Pseudomonadota bacterium]